MVKEVEKLIKIVGKGNLLEFVFIFLGTFQHAGFHNGFIDQRNHINLSSFVRKKEEEPLDKYFNLYFSLQGLFLIYHQACSILIENTQLNTQEVINQIYAAIENERRSDCYSALKKLLKEVVNQAELAEDQKKLKLLNVLANPKGDPIFETVEDFESEVLFGVRKLLNEGTTLDRKFDVNQCVISSYYSIHDMKVDKDIVLFFSTNYNELSRSNEILRGEVLHLEKNVLILSYIFSLGGLVRGIKITNEDGVIKYTIDCQESAVEGWELCCKNEKGVLQQLLKNQDSNEFEQLVTNPENIHYPKLQEENECRANFILSKKNHKNTSYRLALGMVILSIGLYAADYFLMEQKLFNSITNILPQTNLIVAAVLTIIVVYSLFQLLKSPKEPPLSIINVATNENLIQHHEK